MHSTYWNRCPEAPMAMFERGVDLEQAYFDPSMVERGTWSAGPWASLRVPRSFLPQAGARTGSRRNLKPIVTSLGPPAAAMLHIYSISKGPRPWSSRIRLVVKIAS